MLRSDFSFQLPPDLIAQSPCPNRDQSRLLALDRATGGLEHRRFSDLPNFLRAGDLLVLNDSRVIRARLRAIKDRGLGKIEILLLRPAQTGGQRREEIRNESLPPYFGRANRPGEPQSGLNCELTRLGGDASPTTEPNSWNTWWAMLKPGKRVRTGTALTVLDRTGAPTSVHAEVTEVDGEGRYLLQFTGCDKIIDALESLGEVPLPPYIERQAINLDDAARYQTVFARSAGSIAAPTAGLHFTESLLERIRAAGVRTCTVTLHVGAGTFAPVKVDRVEEHRMHTEDFEISEETARAIHDAKARGNRVVAVGTTSLRTLEYSGRHGSIQPTRESTDIFIYPPYRFKVVDALITNFHIPESTLLMLVSAFAAPGEVRGREMILNAYAAAIRERYRFFSYGDAMLVQ